MIYIFMVAVFIATLLVIKWNDSRKSPEEKQREEEKLQREREAWSNRRKRTDIVEVKYLGVGGTSQKRGGLGGALLGGFFAGPLGAVVGAAIPKNAEGLQRFAVKYADGRVKIKELHPNSWEYKELMKYVSWDDIK